MENNTCDSGRKTSQQVPQQALAAEPVMRRWPHPIETADTRNPDLTQILQRQTELLLEIRTLLTQLSKTDEMP